MGWDGIGFMGLSHLMLQACSAMDKLTLVLPPRAVLSKMTNSASKEASSLPPAKFSTLALWFGNTVTSAAENMNNVAMLCSCGNLVARFQLPFRALYGGDSKWQVITDQF